MKKFLPPIILIMGFCGFLAAQIIWDITHLNAQQINEEKSKDQLFESLFKESSFATVEGKQIELKTLKTPVVVLNFWASWCLPCLKEFPSLVKLQAQYGDKISVVGVNGDEEEPEKALQKTKAKYQLNFHHVLDPQSKISDKFLVTAYPFSLIYVKGKVVHVSNKNIDFVGKELIEKIEKALKDK